MKINVILLENIRNYGQVGNIANVRGGYGRYLIDSGKAKHATKKNIDHVNANIKELQKKMEEKTSKSKAIIDQLTELESITVIKNSNDIGKLYGSVTSADIIKMLQDKEIFLHQANLNKISITTVGRHSIDIHFDGGVSTNILLNVEKYISEEEAEAIKAAEAIEAEEAKAAEAEEQAMMLDDEIEESKDK